MSAEQTSRTLSAALCASASRASTERSAKCLGISPPRYLTLRRLAGARYELLAGKPGAMVTEAPPRWGPF